MWQLISIEDQTYHNLAGIFSHSGENMTDQPGMLLFFISRDIILLHKCKDCLQDHMITRMLNGAVCIGNDRVCPPRIKSGYRISLFVVSHRILCLVAIMIWLVHSHDRLHGDLLKATNSLKTVTNLLFLPCKLLFIAAMLNLAATALTGTVTRRLNTPW